MQGTTVHGRLGETPPRLHPELAPLSPGQGGRGHEASEEGPEPGTQRLALPSFRQG